MPSRSFRRRAAVLPLALVVLLPSCSDDDPDPPTPPPTTTAPATTQSPADADEAALRQLAEDWYRTLQELYREGGDPSSASTFLSDPYLSGFLDVISEFRHSGRRVRPDDRSQHQVLDIRVQGDQAEVDECVVDADALLAADGSVTNDAVVTDTYTTKAQRTAEGWRLVERSKIREERGVATCD